MWSRLTDLFTRKKRADLKFVRMEVPLAKLLQKMQEPKDVRLVVSKDGNFTAFCKGCATVVKTTQKDGLIWYICPTCKRMSFSPVGNLERDMALAEQHGGKFEYEVFYFHGLPPGLQPPEI